MKSRDLIYLTIYLLIIIAAAEIIGIKSVSLGSARVTLLPLTYAVGATMVLGIKRVRVGVLKRVYSKTNIKLAANGMFFVMLPLMARYGADISPRLSEIFSKGYIFVLQELGNVGTVLIGLPVALFIGMKREAIGATLGLGREGELAYITEKYTLNSDEGKGVLGQYIFGTLFGALFFSLFAPLLLSIGLSTTALAMAAGVGSASMMSAAVAALSAAVPDASEMITAYAGASQLLTSFLGTYTMVFVAIPLQKTIYNRLSKDRYTKGGESEK